MFYTAYTREYCTLLYKAILPAENQELVKKICFNSDFKLLLLLKSNYRTHSSIFFIFINNPQIYNFCNVYVSL